MLGAYYTLATVDGCARRSERNLAIVKLIPVVMGQPSASNVESSKFESDCQNSNPSPQIYGKSLCSVRIQRKVSIHNLTADNTAGFRWWKPCLVGHWVGLSAKSLAIKEWTQAFTKIYVFRMEVFGRRSCISVGSGDPGPHPKSGPG